MLENIRQSFWAIDKEKWEASQLIADVPQILSAPLGLKNMGIYFEDSFVSRKKLWVKKNMAPSVVLWIIPLFTSTGSSFEMNVILEAIDFQYIAIAIAIDFVE